MPDALGVTIAVPDGVVVEKLRLLPEIKTELAFETLYEKVEVAPKAMGEGAAEKKLTVGVGPAVFSTFTVSEAFVTLPKLSVETTQRVVDPFNRGAVFQDVEYRVPLATVVEAMKVLDARLMP